MLNKLKPSMLLCFILCLFASLAFSETISFRQGQTGTGWSDYNDMQAANVYLESPNTNYGSAAALQAENDAPDSRHFITYMLFTDLIGSNLGQIPVGATIVSATMYIKTQSAADSNSANTLSTYLVTSAWAENTITWNSQPTYNASAISSFVPGSLNTWYSFSLTSAVQAWANLASPNYGIRLYNPGADWANFFSDDDATLANRPYLVVNYTVPEPSVWIMVSLMLGFYCLRRK